MSEVTWAAMALLAGVNLFALGWSAWILRFGIPASLRAQERSSSWEAWRGRLPLTALNMALVGLSTAVGVEWLSASIVSGHPGWIALVVQVSFLIFVDDAWFYAFHRLIHENKWAYNHIHRIHHRAFAPLPSDYLYVHPVEWMVSGGGVPLGLGLLTLMTGGMTSWVFLTFAVFRSLHEVVLHAGMRSVLAPYIPLLASAEHHDQHHARPNCGNYASSLRIWDRVFGTAAST